MKTDSTVVTAGKNEYGQRNVSGWRDIVAVSALIRTIGLKADGTVVVAGSNEFDSWLDIGPFAEERRMRRK